MRGQILITFFLFVATAWADEDDSNAAQYLAKFGYLSLTRSGNHDSTTAIKRFQKFFHLKETGELDEETKTEMSKPRCGLPDVEITGDRVRRYKTGSKWRKTDLTYSFLNHGEDLTRNQVKSIIKRAFQMWSEVTPLRFKEQSGITDFKIKFGAGSHGDDYPFDGKGKVLAHAFLPSNGKIHFDEDEKWSEGKPKWGETHLLWVAVHEIGHAIGLHHSNVRGTIMWPSYGGYNSNIRLHRDDIAGIQSLYGGGGGTRPTTPTSGTQPTRPTSGSCKDKDGRCSSWVQRGYCKSGKYNWYMRNNCTRSCGFCRETSGKR